MTAAKYPQFIHVAKNVVVTNVDRPEHPWTVQYTKTAFVLFEEKHVRHFDTKREALEFARSIA
jgi:hypothetical protein